MDGADSEKDSLTELTYTPGVRPIGTHNSMEYYAFDMEQIRFLEAYAKSLDVDRACEDTGINKRRAKSWMNIPAIQEEIMEINKVWAKSVRMTGKSASSKLLELMDKLEADYDVMGEDNKSKMANALMKGADTYLRAAGMYQRDDGPSGTTIEINIDLSGELQPRSVDGEVVEDIEHERS